MSSYETGDLFEPLEEFNRLALDCAAQALQRNLQEARRIGLVGKSASDVIFKINFEHHDPNNNQILSHDVISVTPLDTEEARQFDINDALNLIGETENDHSGDTFVKVAKSLKKIVLDKSFFADSLVFTDSVGTPIPWGIVEIRSQAENGDSINTIKYPPLPDPTLQEGSLELIESYDKRLIHAEVDPSEDKSRDVELRTVVENSLTTFELTSEALERASHLIDKGLTYIVNDDFFGKNPYQTNSLIITHQFGFRSHPDLSITGYEGMDFLISHHDRMTRQLEVAVGWAMKYSLASNRAIRQLAKEYEERAQKLVAAIANVERYIKD